MGIDLRRADICVPQEVLNIADIGALFEEMGGKTMTKRMKWDFFGDDSSFASLFKYFLSRPRCEFTSLITGKKKDGRGGFAMGSKITDERSREHNDSIFGSFGLCDMDDLTISIDIGSSEIDNFADTQTASVS